MDTTKYYERIKAIESFYPPHPRRPAFPSRTATPDELRKYADEVEAHIKARSEWAKKREEYDKKHAEILADFETEVIRELGIEGHPKAGRLYALAWSKGHAGGLGDVWAEACELVELIK